MGEEARSIVLITGVSGEIGTHLAGHFLAAGWAVLGVDKRESEHNSPAGLVFRTCDLADRSQAASVIDGLSESHGTFDVLVNCAGKIANSPLVSLGPDGWQLHDDTLWAEVISSNLTTSFNATALVVRHMLRARKKGLVVNIGSVCAKGNPGQSAYSAAKAGLNGFTLALAKELGPMGIRVVGLAPGYFDTRSTRENVPAARLAKVANAVPLRRLGTLDEIAIAVDFIVDSNYMNGTIVELNGGLVL